MSLTIQGILVMLVSQLLGNAVPQDDIVNFIQVGMLIVGAIMAWVGRVRAGGITWLGARK